MNHGQGVVRAMLKDMQRQIDGRWGSHLREHEQHDIFHKREHDATEASIAKQEHATSTALQRAQAVIDTRFEATNEWRGAFTDREREFLSKTEYRATLVSTQARIDALEDKDIARSTREAERERAQLRTMTLIGLAATVGGFLLSVFARLLGFDR